MSCRCRESVEGEADFDRSGVEKLLGCFLGNECKLLGDPNGSDDVLVETFLLCLTESLLRCSLLPLLLTPPNNSTGVGGCEDSGLGLDGRTVDC